MKKILTVFALFIISLLFGVNKNNSSPLINTASADVPGDGTPGSDSPDGSDTGSCCDGTGGSDGSSSE